MMMETIPRDTEVKYPSQWLPYADLLSAGCLNIYSICMMKLIILIGCHE